MGGAHGAISLHRPYALELCPRSVILDDGRIAADAPTADILSDAELLGRHRLELPYGFDPRRVEPRAFDARDIGV
jgi:hypothetical protein